MLRIEVFPNAQWPLPEATLHWAYLLAGLLIASHYLPLLSRAWREPQATAVAQPLSTWTVWTLCRMVAFAYGLFILHDLVFLIVVGADIAGRFAMATLILRARWLLAHQIARPDSGIRVARGRATRLRVVRHRRAETLDCCTADRNLATDPDHAATQLTAHVPIRVRPTRSIGAV